MLLAHVLERAGGKSLGELARERIFEPLGMEGSLMYENREEIIPRRATGYHRDEDGRLRIVHNYDFEIVGDGQLYTTVEDLLRWDQYLHGSKKPAIHGAMLTEGTLNNGDPIGYAQGVVPSEYRGLRTVGHGGHSWGFRTQLLRFVEPGLSIAVACNAEFAEPGDLARRVADRFLADRLGPESSHGEEGTADDEDDNGAPSASPSPSPSLSSAELAQFAGSFFSVELDATYRFAVADGQAERLKTTLDEARATGVEITADIYPYRAWATSFTWLTTVFPDRDLDRRDGAEYILSDLLSPDDILLPDYLPEPAYNGLTLAEIAELRGSDPETTLMELLKADTDRGGESPMLGFAMDEPDIESIMAWAHTVVGSDGGLAGSHPRGFGAFTRVLWHYVRDPNVVSLEEGVRKMSSLSAEHVGITKRGAIQEGYYADLVLFDPDTVMDQATYEDPHVPSLGIEKVWVNGQLVFGGGQTTGNWPGKPLLAD